MKRPTLAVIALVPAVLAAGSLAAAPVPQGAPAAAPVLSLMQQTALDCGVSFGLAARAQAAGEAGADRWPADVGTRGKEFFVRTVAQIMDETGADRNAVAALVGASAERQQADPAKREAALPACLLMLDTSGL